MANYYGPQKDLSHLLERTELEKAWLAGFLDGEGCISSGGSLSKHPWLSLTTSNTDLGVIQYITDFWGGRSYSYPARIEGQRPYAVWRATGHEAVAVLRLILPYLMVKSQRARLAVEFFKQPGLQAQREILVTIGKLNKGGE